MSVTASTRGVASCALLIAFFVRRFGGAVCDMSATVVVFIVAALRVVDVDDVRGGRASASRFTSSDSELASDARRFVCFWFCRGGGCCCGCRKRLRRAASMTADLSAS